MKMYSLLKSGILASKISVLSTALALMLLAGCASNGNSEMRPADLKKSMEITAYCPCKKCCGWHRNWRGKPMTNGGYPKKVGITASGVKAKPGTIAADTTKYPFGTGMYVPGYGYGTVEDRGGAIKGERIDLFFKKHREALEWGRVKADVHIWLPDAKVAGR